ncbi:hypothetical protein GCM10023206_08090 [Acinetobacter puyangensis]|uniref:Uncharacterized protein n=1 Tax=Acinetobacter puyangensis TaxID=1096779 RepID=A0A240E688_9GAMM|nr:hypothetical protein [Acinetobacter puyangensis]SNX44112.1 hypothetical protein SAMN05421731_102271 [Acinetobacter puyangensis]
MKLFLDCEFNGFGGELISLALVDEEGQFFYEVLPCATPKDWVSQHVLPKLNKAPITKQDFQKKLAQFLNQYTDLHIIADWPEDLSLFSRALILSAGKCMVTPPLIMELWLQQDQVSIFSETPHYALSDAQALAKVYMSNQIDN